MAAAHRPGWWRSISSRCSRQLKPGHEGHLRPKFQMKSGPGAPAGDIVCRACASPAQMAAIRKETARL